MPYFDITLALMLVTGVCGYYIGHRGIVGVKNDLMDVKTDLSIIKARFNPHAEVQTVTTVTPLAVTETASNGSTPTTV